MAQILCTFVMRNYNNPQNKLPIDELYLTKTKKKEWQR